MNWLQSIDNDELMTEYSSKLAIDLAKEAGHDFNSYSAEQCQEVGAQLTAAWFEGKTTDEVIDYLVDKYGTESEKQSYKEWLIARG